ncbi:MAG: hypothetical protein CMI56_02780 [Parcubacteria group bacterium]|nr:hypothetical protein [Parcubacteria group bacterium]|tara:strand:- start:1618 stop:1899 length:282 start_codon:yes stop_codon:yes gene_type:complete
MRIFVLLVFAALLVAPVSVGANDAIPLPLDESEKEDLGALLSKAWARGCGAGYTLELRIRVIPLEANATLGQTETDSAYGWGCAPLSREVSQK